mmetsp:Transcript_7994/g.24161  ORF Transcript_7994/g.24161 Transcript_7994/m.24161 type:complete len:827 (-) Transcript_7994:2764-5244(-)
MRSHPARLHHARLHHHRGRLHHARLREALRLHHDVRRRIADRQVAKAGHGAGHHWVRHVVRHEVVGGALLLLLCLFLLLRLLVQRIDAARVLPEHLDEEGHRIVEHVLPPGQLEANIRPDEVVAGEQARGEALLHVVVDEVSQQGLGELGVAAVERGLHGILVHFVLLGQVDGLLITLVLLVHQSGNPAHLDELVALQLLGERDLIEEVEVLDALPQIFELLALDVDVVDGLVDCLDVVLLCGLQVRQHERQVARLLDLPHNSGVVHLGHDGVEQCVHLHRILFQVESDGPVVDLMVGDLLEDHLELVMRVRNCAVRHHRIRRSVELVVVRIEEDGLGPEVVALARLNQLGDVELRGVHLDEVHELLGLVLRVQNRELGVHADVGALAAEAGVQKLDELLEVAVLLVLRGKVLQVVRVHDDVHTRDLGAAELFRLHARDVDLPPGLRVVGLFGCLDGLGELAKLHEARGELGVVRDRLVQDFRGLIRLLVVQPVADALHIRGVGAADEFLHLAQAVGLGVRVDELGVHHRVLGALAGHEQEPDQILEKFEALRGLDDLLVVRGILGLQVRVDGLCDLAVLKLGLAELVPDGAVAAAGSEFLGPLQGLQVHQQGVHGLGIEAVLLVDEEGLLVEAVGLAQGDLGNLRTVVVVQAVDVVHHASLVGLDGCQDEQVLQVFVLAEVRGLVQHDLLEELDEFVGQVRADEGLDSGGNFLGIRGLWQRGGDDLVDDLAPVLVRRAQDQVPQLGALALDQVARLQPEEAVAVRDVYKLIVALAPAALVSSVGEVRIAILAVLADDCRIVELVGLEEGLRIPVGVDVDLGDAVV